MVVWQYGLAKDDFYTTGRPGPAIRTPGTGAGTLAVSGGSVARKAVGPRQGPRRVLRRRQRRPGGARN